MQGQHKCATFINNLFIVFNLIVNMRINLIRNPINYCEYEYLYFFVLCCEYTESYFFLLQSSGGDFDL